MYYTHLGCQTSIFGKNCAYYIQIFTGIIIIIRVYLNRPELILSRGCGLAAQSWS